jgi:hypothetical protein
MTIINSIHNTVNAYLGGLGPHPFQYRHSRTEYQVPYVTKISTVKDRM